MKWPLPALHWSHCLSLGKRGGPDPVAAAGLPAPTGNPLPAGHQVEMPAGKGDGGLRHPR